MKQFTLKVSGKEYRVESEGVLEDAWKFDPEGNEIKDWKIPEIWASNLSKVVEKDLTKERAEFDKAFKLRQEFESLLDDSSFLEKFLKHLKEL